MVESLSRPERKCLFGLWCVRYLTLKKILARRKITIYGPSDQIYIPGLGIIDIYRIIILLSLAKQKRVFLSS